MTVLNAGTKSLIVTYPDERVFDAMKKMLENNIGRLPVVDRKNPQKLVGYLNRANVLGSWHGHLHEESVREHGWFRNFADGRGPGGLGGVLTGRVVAIKGDEISISADSQAGRVADEFVLTAPARGVFVGDQVRVDYRNDDHGHKIALRIVELSSRQ